MRHRRDHRLRRLYFAASLTWIPGNGIGQDQCHENLSGVGPRTHHCMITPGISLVESSAGTGIATTVLRANGQVLHVTAKSAVMEADGYIDIGSIRVDGRACWKADIAGPAELLWLVTREGPATTLRMSQDSVVVGNRLHYRCGSLKALSAGSRAVHARNTAGRPPERSDYGSPIVDQKGLFVGVLVDYDGERARVVTFSDFLGDGPPKQSILAAWGRDPGADKVTDISAAPRLSPLGGTDTPNNEPNDGSPKPEGPPKQDDWIPEGESGPATVEADTTIKDPEEDIVVEVPELEDNDESSDATMWDFLLTPETLAVLGVGLGAHPAARLGLLGLKWWLRRRRAGRGTHHESPKQTPRHDSTPAETPPPRTTGSASTRISHSPSRSREPAPPTTEQPKPRPEPPTTVDPPSLLGDGGSAPKAVTEYVEVVVKDPYAEAVRRAMRRLMSMPGGDIRKGYYAELEEAAQIEYHSLILGEKYKDGRHPPTADGPR